MKRIVLVSVLAAGLVASAVAQDVNIILPTVDSYYATTGRYLLSSPVTNRGMGRWAHLNLAVSNTNVYNYDDSVAVIAPGTADSTSAGRKADYLMSFTSKAFGGSEATSFSGPTVYHYSQAYVWKGLRGVVLAVQLKNLGSSAITGKLSFEFYPRIDQSYSGHSVRWRSQDSIAFYYRPGLSHYVAFKALNRAPVGLRTVNGTEFFATVTYAEGQPDSLRFKAANYASFDASRDAASADRSMIFLNQGSVTIDGGAQTGWYYYAVAYDTSEVKVIASLKEVETKYRSTLVSVERATNIIPEGYELSQNYPNPFNPATKIKFSVPQRSSVTLSVYDELGRNVCSLVNQQLDAGTYVSTFDASNLSSGVYYYVLRAGSFVESHKMILIR
ncbi:T9SS C-terminal target domain-containing protein [bacterium]|nr:MAG: T9SS C-terminal target domain-containing protein [bacterium]